MFLSLIVPVYNVEAYLIKCVDSLLAQDISTENYEIILVDDGSKDRSGHLCDKFAETHNNIRVIHQPNKGLGAARNTGIAAAIGKYIQFVDSDDYLCPNVLGGIVHQLENQALDILRINYQNVRQNGEVFEPNKYSKPFDNYSEDVCDGLSFLNERLGFACYAVQFVCRASLLKHEGNGFKEGIYFEDTEWTSRILLQAKRIASSPSLAYNYTYREDSISRNSNLEKKHKTVADKLGLIESLKMQRARVSDIRWFNGMIAHTVLSILTDVSRYFFNSRKQFIKQIKRLGVFPLSTYHATISATKKIMLINLSPNVYCYIQHYKNG